MFRPQLNAQRLAALFLLGWALFNYPLLALFNRDVFVLGMPLLYVWIFTTWLGLIIAIMIVSECRDP